MDKKSITNPTIMLIRRWVMFSKDIAKPMRTPASAKVMRVLLRS